MKLQLKLSSDGRTKLGMPITRDCLPPRKNNSSDVGPSLSLAVSTNQLRRHETITFLSTIEYTGDKTSACSVSCVRSVYVVCM